MKPYSDSTQDGYLPLGIFGGAVAAVIAAIVWAAITAATNYTIGFMAVGVGFVVAYAVRFCGRGHGRAYAISAAILALLGCLLGNFLAACAVAANQNHVAILSAIAVLLPHFAQVISDGFSFMDLVFYAIGAYFGYRYATVPLRAQRKPIEPV
ncbi:MAG TPA: hypothetical protein VIJ12_02595 [Candidatus Baltobacteraceae bacterium]